MVVNLDRFLGIGVTITIELTDQLFFLLSMLMTGFPALL